MGNLVIPITELEIGATYSWDTGIYPHMRDNLVRGGNHGVGNIKIKACSIGGKLIGEIMLPR